MMKNKNFFNCLVKLLIVIGALNWGLVGFFQFDLVATLFGDMSTLSRIIYSLVGLAGVSSLISLKKCCKKSDA